MAGLVLILPGISWWVWLGNRRDDPVEVVARILGVSVAFNALLFLLFFYLNISINWLIIVLISVIFISLIIWGFIKKKSPMPIIAWGIGLLGIAFVVWWRIFQARQLVLPAWVDPLHHVLIIRKILETGILPHDMTPYLQVPFYYHYALHSTTAMYSFISGLDPANALLIWGQVLNAGISLSIYVLAKTLFKDWRLAVLAGLMSTFMTKMPGYYLSWGRYTLITGLVLLPLALSAVVRILEKKVDHLEWGNLVLLTAGTLLAHYFVGFLLGVFLVLTGLIFFLSHLRNFKLAWKTFTPVFLAATAGFLLALPWLVRVLIYSRVASGLALNTPGEGLNFFSGSGQWSYLGYIVGPARGYVLAGLALIGLGLTIWRKSSRAFAVWCLVIVIQALPWGLVLKPFRFDHYAIVLFLPIVLLSTAAFGWLAALLKRLSNLPLMEHIILIVVCLSCVLWGALEEPDVINQTTVLADQADLEALQWIDANVSGDARFFINTTNWGYGTSRGVDGGAWILPYTGRWSLAPTLFTTFSADAQYKQQIRDWGKAAQTITDCTPEFWSLVADADLSHIYLHQKRGGLQANALQTCQNLELIYDKGAISVWEIQR